MNLPFFNLIMYACMIAVSWFGGKYIIGGIMTTGGGTMIANNLTVNTSGTSSAAIRTDRGGGGNSLYRRYRLLRQLHLRERHVEDDSHRGRIYYFRQQQPACVSFLLAGPSGQQPRGGQRQRAGGAGEPLLSLLRSDGRVDGRRCAAV